MGKKVYLNRIDTTEKDSCQYENKPIDVLKGIDKEMFVSIQAGDIAVNLKNKALEKNNTKKCICLINNGSVRFTDFLNKSINCISLGAMMDVQIPTSINIILFFSIDTLWDLPNNTEQSMFS